MKLYFYFFIFHILIALKLLTLKTGMARFSLPFVGENQKMNKHF
jgi:hypothetical protein